MIDEFVQHITGLFPRRFVFNALLPTVVFGSASAAVAIVSFSSFSAASTKWSSLDLASQALVVLAYLAVMWFVSAAVASQWRGIVRLYEGYPLKRIFKGRAPGRRWHEVRMEELDEETGQGVRRYYRYPQGEDERNLMPTRLGNVLLAAESYPRDRYRIDPIIFWPRLYPLLPEQVQREHEEYIINYEFPLVVSFEAALTTLLSATMLVLTRQSPGLFLAVLLCGMALSYAFYHLSLSAAEEYGEQLRSAFDLYRDRLLDAWPTVPDVMDEREAFRAIREFVVEADRPAWAADQERHTARRSQRGDVGADAQEGDAAGAPGP